MVPIYMLLVAGACETINPLLTGNSPPPHHPKQGQAALAAVLAEGAALASLLHALNGLRRASGCQSLSQAPGEHS